jgi:aspartyl-tRNA(Asn)/glutamyl-tRNA(Gln) amidotransferase subunit A
MDSRTRRKPIPDYTRALTGKIKGLRIGIPRNYFFDRVEPDVLAAVHAALRTLEKIGGLPVEVDLPTASSQAVIFNEIACPEAYVYHEPYLQTQREDYGTEVRNRIETGRLFLSMDYVRAQLARGTMKDEFRFIFRTADVMVTPTLPIAAPAIDRTTISWGNESEGIGTALTRFTRPFNIAGLPAISIPCGFTSNGLPIGLQIAGKKFDESTVLRVAHAYEQEMMWTKHRPSL